MSRLVCKCNFTRQLLIIICTVFSLFLLPKKHCAMLKYLRLLCCTVINSNKLVPQSWDVASQKKHPSCCCVAAFWSQAHIPYHTSDVILLTLDRRCLSLKYWSTHSQSQRSTLALNNPAQHYCSFHPHTFTANFSYHDKIKAMWPSFTALCLGLRQWGVFIASLILSLA